MSLLGGPPAALATPLNAMGGGAHGAFPPLPSSSSSAAEAGPAAAGSLHDDDDVDDYNTADGEDDGDDSDWKSPSPSKRSRKVCACMVAQLLLWWYCQPRRTHPFDHTN
jgi:hypothetical protein